MPGFSPRGDEPGNSKKGLFMVLRASLAGLGLVFFAGSCALAEGPIVSLTEQAATDRWAYDFLADLTSEIGPRPAASPAAQRAAQWAQQRLRQAGFDEVHLETFPVTSWTRGPESAEITAPLRQRLAVAALGQSVATPAAGIDAEIALFKSFQALRDVAAGSLSGKIAVVTQRMTRTQDGSGYGAIVAMRVAGASEAARKGAVAYLIRSVGTDNHRLPHTGVMAYAKDMSKIPAAALSNPDADQLERLAVKGSVKLHLALASESHENAEAVTVVAELRGRENPDQVVLLGGHLDSWDLGTGAIDDGAGVAIVAGAARLIGLLPQRPRRTIRVVLFGAEEIGGASKPYADGQGNKVGSIVIAGESDFGGRKIYQASLPAGAAATAFGKKMAAVIEPLGVDLSTMPARHGGADLEDLGARGVPFVQFSQNGLDYFDIHHTADDTFDKIDAADLAQNIAVWASFAWLAAEDGIDFRAIAAQVQGK
jgi:Zn-dependent M28 family amino/carboxypeptidase